MADTYKMSAENKARFMRTCLHFNGVANAECDEGIPYQDAARPLTEEERQQARESHYCDASEEEQWGIAKRVPCLTRGDEGSCPFFALPTEEDVERREEETERMLKESAVARKAITEHIKEKGHTGKNVKHALDCPVCEDGMLHYRYAGSHNGHIQAQCTTENCIFFME